MQPPETQFVQQSRYAELRTLMETRVQDLPKEPFYNSFYLCYAYSKVRHYDRLFPCLDQLQGKIDRGDKQLYWFDFSASAKLMRAQAMIELGDFPKAVAFAEEAERLTRSGDTYLQFRIYALTAAGLSQALAGDRGAARRYAAELEKVSADPVVSSDKYIGLARIAMALGDYPKALDAIRRDDAGSGFRAFADLLSGASLAGQSIFTYWQLPKEYIRGKALLETGEVDAARKSYDALLANPGTVQSADLYWLILFDRGTISERDGRRAEAIDLLRRAVDQIETQRASIPTEANKIGFVGDKQRLYLDLVATLIADGRDDMAFEYAERAKARALVDLLASRRRFAGRDRGAPDLGPLLDSLAEADAQAVTQDASNPDAATAARARSAGIRDTLTRQAPDLASLVVVSTASLAEVRERLRPDETLIEYYGDAKRLFAFVLDRRRMTVVRLDGQGLTEAIRRFRSKVQNPNNNDFRADSEALYDRLVRPLRALIGERLTIVPHGAIHYLPFAALSDGNRYLIETATLRLLPSASVARFLRSDEPPPPQQLLVLANPTYDLPGAEAEAKAIAGLWPEARLLLRAEASKDAVRALGGAYRHLHFATHGRFDAGRPLASGLYLAGDPNGAGPLTVDELYGLRLSADLVTLSACETALGDVASGDDVIGLTRGFLYAGAQALVASLWPIADRETTYLMAAFYADLRRLEKSDALRRAQLAARARYPHPFYWAAFQLSGDGS